MPYDLLKGIRVLEVALLAPDALGGHLADLGAEVIKIEEPPRGDYVRSVTPVAIGTPHGLSFFHTNWNRGKKSLALNLKTPEGKDTFLELAKKSHIVIEGLRVGSFDRWGIGYEALRSVNPAIVFCSLSGLGRSGPYRNLPTHGMFFDAYAGYIPAVFREDGSVYPSEGQGGGGGMQASGLWAAVAVLSALTCAFRTGQGALVEVAEAEVSAYWQIWRIQAALNAEKIHMRPSYGVAKPNQESVRYTYYQTKDDQLILLAAPEAKFWDNFLHAVDREDLKVTYPPKFADFDRQPGEEGLRRELVEIFKTRTRDEWVALFIDANVAGGPVNTPAEIPTDPHFASRDNVYSVDQPDVGTIKLLGTPIKVEGQLFTAQPAPYVGQHTEEVLREVLAFDEDRISRLLDAGAVAVAPAH